MAIKLCHVQRDLQLACQPGFAPQGDFLIGQKVTKDPPKAGPSPALWNPPRGTGWRVHLPFSALGPVGPHRCPGSSTEVGYFCGSLCAYSQGLTLVRRCSQRWAAWLPAAGTPLLQGRPGHRNHPTIGPVAQGGLGRSLGGNALSGFWFLLPAQKKPPAGSVPTRLASRDRAI